MFAGSHGVTGWGVENVIGWVLINAIFLMAFKVKPVGECGLTFNAQSEMSASRKKEKKKKSWHERDKICQSGELGSQNNFWIS